MKKRSFGARRKIKNSADIEITSLLDILVILLVFLLSAYSSSDLEINLVKDLTLPSSKSALLGSKSVVIQVDVQRKIWIDGNIVAGPLEKWEQEAIPELLDVLKEKKNKISRSGRNIAGKSEQKINIVLDQNLPYEVLQRVMHTSALAGFSEFKFIVQGSN